MRTGLLWGLLAAVLAVAPLGCNKSPSLSRKKSEPKIQPNVEGGFRDMAESAGLDFHMSFLPGEQGETFKINLYDHGAGVAVGDYDGDGDDDIYLLNQLGANALYRNEGNHQFVDVTEQMNVGLGDRICVSAAFADYDNDADQDLFVTSTRGGNVLFRNENNESFKDVTEEAGVALVGHSQSAVFFDYDRDSFLDLLVLQTALWTSDRFDDEQKYFIGMGDTKAINTSPIEHNKLYRNQGNGTFVDVTESSNLAGRGWSSDAAVFDYDQDGWLDILIVCMFGPTELYRNEQNGSFKNVTAEILGPTPFGGTGGKVFDFNNDGNLDIYVVDMHSDMWMGMDREHTSLQTAITSQRKRFKSFFGPEGEVSEALKENDRRLEVIHKFSLSEVVFGNAFYQSQGDGHFAEVSQNVKLETFWPWGIADGDFNNDGFIDVFVPSGMGYPFYYWRNHLLMNEGGERFVERTSEMGVEPPSRGKFLDKTIGDKPCPRSSRAAVAADFDADGRLELVVNNFNDHPYYYVSDLPRNNYVAFKLQGTQSNRDAIGAVVRVTTDRGTMLRIVPAAGGYLATNSKRLHFGLPKGATIERVEIDWPSGQQQVLQNVELNQLHEIAEPAGEVSNQDIS